MPIKITLENIGPITKADLELGQITVIVGENNVGKSFVLKSVYSVFKAFEMERMLLREEVERALRTCKVALSLCADILSVVLTGEELEEIKKQIDNTLRDIEFYLEKDVSTLDLDNIVELIKNTANVVKQTNSSIKRLKEEIKEKKMNL